MRVFLSLKDGQVHYRVKGVRTFAPLFVSVEQWLEWGESLPERSEPVLVEGEFYWVLIVNDPDAEYDWENEVMPARYGGKVDGKDQWFTINGDNPDWPVRWIGEHIPKPGLD